MYLDADDVFYPEHMGRVFRAMDGNPEIAFFKTRMEFTVPVHPQWQVKPCTRSVLHTFQP